MSCSDYSGPATGILGYRYQEGKTDIPIHGAAWMRLEEILLNSMLVTSFHKFRARIFGNCCIGVFKPAGESTDYMKYYLVWCRKHQSYSVCYAKGHEGRITCDACESFYRVSRLSGRPED